MQTYAEMLGIDLAKLEAERFAYYRRPQPKYSSPTIKELPESMVDWEPVNRAANKVHYNTNTLRLWAKQNKIQSKKVNGRVWVYFPDVKRHAG
jgi:hypothetical protein